ncbi:uncharacterized protein LOC128213250 [Mya arenaria]|uniref:uncharacterized protein LOC128213250 n=1 Tax=Mya arenaria TaxID=6604 RepID=UPI0022E6F8A0|nr:uncharacterized protein LOC128213250 [Mya arenaria]XP_052774781.1 uncharacterized protein LOC128213250 [Mya arenaria]XP_052774782.1 uncharacterized protein LOC128213250 [Mya arenaria]XP_052774783.1 uncharacterized protein LOC128213250 [Mya arenaria]XP_052774784.1 uncharacterized protein LOC128213250 [Mya arenaria]XP_052774785.1 uncharacterized protein LOC128213250 [Mya arenaria]XP_052774786.1 uncharacterized protein LOC128213250 [Mya arenaria]
MKNPRNHVPMGLLDIIKNGYFQQVRFLVESGTDLDQKDEERRTALMLCAFIEPENWGVGLCRLLIENGATLYYRDKYGLNAFHFAVIYDRVELVRVYLKAIDFNLKEADKLGNTALHYAVRAGNPVVTKLIAQAYVKYRIPFDKANNDGFTALQEAHRLNKRRCARILENTEVLADMTHIEANTPLDMNGLEQADDRASQRSLQKSPSRPRLSVVSHHSSKSSLLSSSDISSFRRSPTIYSIVTRTRRTRRVREPQESIMPNEKNNKQLIRCASTSDLRNNPEYLFQISPIDATYHNDVHTDTTSKRSGRAKSAFVRRSDVESGSFHPRNNWRTELRTLYMKYEFQCTPSYRDSVVSEDTENASLPPLDKPITPATSEHAINDDEKGRKSRAKSAAASKEKTDESLSAGKTRQHGQQSKTNTRKNSQVTGHGGKMGSVDGSLESSSESINSSASSKRQADGKISKTGKEGGRQSRTTTHKGAATNVDDSLRVINE